METVKTYTILFDFDALVGENNEPNTATCTVYSMLAMQANLVGHAIQDGKLDDAIPYVDLIADKPEAERERLMAWLDFNDIMKPRKLRLAQDEIGTDKILAVFDSNASRIRMWRGAGAVCFQLSVAPELVLPR